MRVPSENREKEKETNLLLDVFESVVKRTNIINFATGKHFCNGYTPISIYKNNTMTPRPSVSKWIHGKQDRVHQYGRISKNNVEIVISQMCNIGIPVLTKAAAHQEDH